MSPAERRFRLEAGRPDRPDRTDRLDKRLTDLLRAEGEAVSRATVQEWIRQGLVVVDGAAIRDPNHRLRAAGSITLTAPEKSAGVVPVVGTLQMVHVDEALIVLAKPAGISTHPAPGMTEVTLVHRLLAAFPELAGMSGAHEDRPGIVHRLDKDTSGLMAVARTEAARLALTKAFADRTVDKRYLAIVHGRPAETGTIDAAIGRHPVHKTKMAVLAKGGKPAKSAWKRLWVSPGGGYSLLEVRIFTGRTHQIRVHLAHLGHPIVGDAVYGRGLWRQLDDLPFLKHDARIKLARRQMLHAWRLSFSHPDSGEAMRFVLPPPKDFVRLPFFLARRTQRVVIIGQPGAGKSRLLAEFAKRGLPTFSADGCVAGMYQPDGEGARLIRARWGRRFTDETGAVDKARLLRGMLESDAIRREIVDMIHPLVQYELLEFWRRHEDARVAFAEIPLFLEAGWHVRSEDPEAGRVDVLIGVERAEEDRAACLARRGWNNEAAARLDGWQWPWPDKRGRCDLIVRNPGDPEGIRLAAEKALADLLNMRRAGLRALRETLDALWNPESN